MSEREIREWAIEAIVDHALAVAQDAHPGASREAQLAQSVFYLRLAMNRIASLRPTEECS